MSSLGDIILTAPVLRNLRLRWPDAHITILVKPQFSGAAEKSPFISDVLVFRGLASALKAINKARYDIILDLHVTLRSRLLSAFSGGKLKARYRKDSLARLLFVNFRISSPTLKKHTLERYLESLDAIGVPAIHREPLAGDWDHGSAPPVSVTGVHETIFIGANPGSVWPTKRWPREYWARLVSELARTYGTKVLLVGGKNDTEWNAWIEKAAAPGSVLNLTGKTGIDGLMDLIRNLKLFITNDSGPMHIAAAFGVPAAAIFGPTTRELGFFPRGSGNVVLEEELACRPCALHGSLECPRGHFLCMRMNTPDKVLTAARHILGKANIKEKGGSGRQTAGS